MIKNTTLINFRWGNKDFTRHVIMIGTTGTVRFVLILHKEDRLSLKYRKVVVEGKRVRMGRDRRPLVIR